MRFYFTVLFTFMILIKSQAQNTKFPESFHFDASIFKGVKLTAINKEMKKLSLFENPAVVVDQKIIRNLTDDISIVNIKRVYYEIYSSTEENDHNKAGVLVFEFNSEDNLAKAASNLRNQSNYRILKKDNYLIQVWNDGKDTEMMF